MEGHECIARNSLGAIRNYPVNLTVDGRTVVIIPTFMPNATKPAGVVAMEIVDILGAPQFALLWQAPRFDSPDALLRFRRPPSHLAVSASPVDGEQYVWVVDRSTLLGIGVRDGTIIAETGLAGRSNSIQPLHHDGVLYVTSQASDGGGLLQAFIIEY